MKKSKFAEQQIVFALQKAETVVKVSEFCLKLSKIKNLQDNLTPE